MFLCLPLFIVFAFVIGGRHYNFMDLDLDLQAQVQVQVLASEDDDAHIVIEENGAGIKKEDIKLVFKPFYRADEPRSLDAVSIVGLGSFLGSIGSSN